MAEPPRYEDADGEATRTPLWVKVSGVIAAIIVALFIVLLLIGGHGPSRHTLSDDQPIAVHPF